MDCEGCSAWDDERGGCTIPDYDLWYACPNEAAKPENRKELIEWIDWLQSKGEV